MQYNEDKRIKLKVPFLKEGSVLYVDSRIGTSHFYIESHWGGLVKRFGKVGYTFIFLPDLVLFLDKDLRQYLFPGDDKYLFAEDMYQRVQDLAKLGDKTGFLYRWRGDLFFRILPESPDEDIVEEIDDFIAFLEDSKEPDRKEIKFRKASKPRHPNIRFSRDFCYDEDEEYERIIEPESVEPSLNESDNIRFSVVGEKEDAPDPRVEAILAAWRNIENEFGITIEDLEIFLGYKVKLSRLTITTSKKIFLTDFSNQEVKMDDLTKALYFYYLKHINGARLRDMHEHEDEVLHIYSGITGRDDVEGIRNSVRNLLDPFGNSLNVSTSRIKKAFKDIVGDRIARFYYIYGPSGGIRKIELDRDLVIWEH